MPPTVDRVCFVLYLRPDRIDHYLAAHEHVWPDMLEALRSAGWSNYSLFLRRADGMVIGYFETEDLAGSLQRLEVSDVNHRWQSTMAKFFTSPVGFEDSRLSHYFYLA